MGLPMEKGAVKQLEQARRESDQGTVTGEAKDGEGHAREVPVVKVVKKAETLFERLTGVAP
jgi:hypothetical protein